MKSIYKYPLIAADRQTLVLHGRVLSAGVQDDRITVWAVHDDDAQAIETAVHIMGTGHQWHPPENARFVGTVFLGSYLVFHVFVVDPFGDCRP